MVEAIWHDEDHAKGLSVKGRTTMKAAVYAGHVLPGVGVCADAAQQSSIFEGAEGYFIAIPTAAHARVAFLKKWARLQKRIARRGGATGFLVLPMFASAAAAQSDESMQSLDGVVEATVQSDGSLLLTMSDGSTILVPEDKYQVTADGRFLVSTDALAGVEGVAGAAGIAAEAGLAGILPALGGMVAVGAIAGAGGGSAASEVTSGFVVDGYISGATVFRDADGDGVLDDGEVSTTTDELGAFSLGGDPNGPIVATGGVDISTGLNFEGTLKAPAGSTVVSPLTTLVQEIIENDDTGETTADEAVGLVNEVLGLDEGTDLLNEDPIAASNNESFAAGVQVVNIVNLGVAAGADEGDVLEALAEKIVDAANEAPDDPDPTPENPLSDGDTVEEVLSDAFEGVADAPDASDIEAVANTAANANSAVDDAVEAAADTGGDVVDAAADVQQVVQNDIADEIAEQIEEGNPVTEVDQDTIEEDAEDVPDIGDGVVTFDRALSEDFSEPVVLADEQAHDTWYVDRFAPEVFETVADFGTVDENFPGESVLRLTTEAVADQDSFRQTQGRKYDLADGSTEASIQLYIDPAWEPAADATTGFRQAGFWTTALNDDGNIGAYPIIEFSTLDGAATFRVFTGVSVSQWEEVTLPDGIPYGEFIDLKIAVNDDGSVTYTIGSETFTTTSDDPDNTFDVASLDNVILQGYNQDPADENAARPSYDIYWDNLASNGGYIESDTNLSDFSLEINHVAEVYEVLEGAVLTMTIDQVDGLQINGAGTVKLVGAFDPDVDLSGISAPIDATELTGTEFTFAAAQADGLTVDLDEGDTLNIDVTYAPLSEDNQELVPLIDLSGITVNGSNSPAELFKVLDAGSDADTFKLLWNFGDNNYYDSLPGGTPDINAANIEIGNLYVDYLLAGGEPLLDVVQTKVGGTADFEARQQSLHDNLLGNLKESVVQSRLASEALLADNRSDEAADQFGDRPIYSGDLTDTDDLLATQIWDVANGYPRSDFTVPAGAIYVLNGDTVVDADGDSENGITPFADFSEAVDAAKEGAYVVVGSATYAENESVYINASITISAEDGAILEGGLRVESGSTESVVNVSGLDINVTGTSYGIYLNGTDLTLNVTNVDIDGGGSGTSRGIINQSQTDPIINVSGGSLTNLQSGVYLNPGSALNIDGTVFNGNTAAIGTDDPAALSVVNATFDGNDEAIGISGDHNNNNVTLANNQYVQETDQVLVYFAREDGEASPVAIPGEWSNVTIVQSSDPDNNKAQLDTITGTDGNDVIVDNNLDTTIDLTAGGSDFVLFTVGAEDEGVNLVTGFTAGAAGTEGLDVLAFIDGEGGDAFLVQGLELEILSLGDTVGANTGAVIYTTDLNLSVTDQNLFDDDADLSADEEAVLTAARELVAENFYDNIGMAVATNDGADTLLVDVHFGEDLEDTSDDFVVAVAYLKDVVVTDLTADNFYDFSAVSANT